MESARRQHYGSTKIIVIRPNDSCAAHKEFCRIKIEFCRISIILILVLSQRLRDFEYNIFDYVIHIEVFKDFIVA